MTEEMFRYEYRSKTSKERLEKLIIETDKENQKRKTKRTVMTYFFFFVQWFLVFYWIDDCELFNIPGILNAAAGALFIAGVQFYLCMLWYGLVFSKSDEEDAYLESLKKRYYDEY